MAAPTPTARVAPSGIKLKNGHPTKITFARDPNISFWEKTVTPPGIDGGDPIDQTTMFSVTWREKAPRTLKEGTESKATVAYDPVVYDEILALINVEDTATITFPDGSTYAYYVYIQKFEPQEMQEGEMPTAEITICSTNFDHVAKVEAGPALASVAGT